MGEKRGYPPPKLPIPSCGRKGSREGKRKGKAEAEGDLEAGTGQQKGKTLGTKAHLRICSASAGPPVLGHHGTAVGHESV